MLFVFIFLNNKNFNFDNSVNDKLLNIDIQQKLYECKEQNFIVDLYVKIFDNEFLSKTEEKGT